MGRIVNPNSMRMAMNSIKRNVDSYSMSYRKAKTTLAKHSHESSKAKGLTANAILNQLSCYESLMDMFVIVAENISKDCDAMSMRVGNEYLNEDNINSMIEVQEGIKKRCTERIEHYRHRETEFASYPILSGYCRLQIQRNYSIRSNAETIINLMERKLEKINEIEQSTSELFLAEKAALEKIEDCIEELKKSGKGGFTFQNLPAWATNMNKALLEKYSKEM